MLQDWQTWVAAVIVICAASYLGRMLVKKMTGQGQSGGASCPNKASKSAASGIPATRVLPLVQIGNTQHDNPAPQSTAPQNTATQNTATQRADPKLVDSKSAVTPPRRSGGGSEV